MLLVRILVWLVYFGFTAAVIVVDGKIARARVEREGSVDFMDRSVTPYILIGLLCGPLPLIFYFGATRRSVVGWLIGVGAAGAVYAATIGVGMVLSMILR
jgi:hypothetical protein